MYRVQGTLGIHMSHIQNHREDDNAEDDNAEDEDEKDVALIQETICF